MNMAYRLTAGVSLPWIQQRVRASQFSVLALEKGFYPEGNVMARLLSGRFTYSQNLQAGQSGHRVGMPFLFIRMDEFNTWRSK
jgi:hypothetical protein